VSRSERSRVIKTILLLCAGALAMPLLEAGTARSQAAAAATAPAAGSASTLTPVQLADSAPQGSLRNPYKDSDAAVVAAGQRLFMSYACSGCHGGTGGGGMCPPLTDGVWVYGGDDDTLFRLVAYGSQILQSKGYTRKQMENVVAPMPQMGQVVKTADDLWRILVFVRATYHGPADCKYGCKPGG
jgi:mono/diheme cytochrome c family protein